LCFAHGAVGCVMCFSERVREAGLKVQPRSIGSIARPQGGLIQNWRVVAKNSVEIYARCMA
jgi:hypothetical protein